MSAPQFCIVLRDDQNRGRRESDLIVRALYKENHYYDFGLIQLPFACPELQKSEEIHYIVVAWNLKRYWINGEVYNFLEAAPKKITDWFKKSSWTPCLLKHLKYMCEDPVDIYVTAMNPVFAILYSQLSPSQIHSQFSISINDIWRVEYTDRNRQNDHGYIYLIAVEKFTLTDAIAEWKKFTNQLCMQEWPKIYLNSDIIQGEFLFTANKCWINQEIVSMPPGIRFTFKFTLMDLMRILHLVRDGVRFPFSWRTILKYNSIDESLRIFDKNNDLKIQGSVASFADRLDKMLK